MKDAKQLTGTVHPIRGIRIVLYEKQSDVVAIVNGEEIEAVPKSKLRAEAEPFIPVSVLKARSIVPESDEDEDEDQDDPVGEETAEDTGIDHTVDLDVVARTIDAARVEQVLELPTAEELAAARCIAKQYYRRQLRRQPLPKKGLAEARARAFLSCLKISAGMARPYRMLFLGPFPHALVCLEKLNAYLINAKKRASLRLHAGQHANYENLKADVDDTMYVLFCD